MPLCSRLPLAIDVAPLLAALARLPLDAWQPHFNSAYFSGDWSGVALIAPADAPTALAPGRGAPTATPAFRREPAWQALLAPIRAWADGGNWRIDWARFGAQALTEPFFRDSVELALKRPFNLAFRRDTALEALLDWQQRRPGIAPTAFVLHASRCGSTLIARMLSRLPSHTVLSEPPPLDALLRAHYTAPRLPRRWSNGPAAPTPSWKRCAPCSRRAHRTTGSAYSPKTFISALSNAAMMMAA